MSIIFPPKNAAICFKWQIMWEYEQSTGQYERWQHHLLHSCIFSYRFGSKISILPHYTENKLVSIYFASHLPSSHKKKNTNEKDWNRASHLASHVANVFRENVSIIVTSLFGLLMGDIYSSKCKMLLDLGDIKTHFIE